MIGVAEHSLGRGWWVWEREGAAQQLKSKPTLGGVHPPALLPCCQVTILTELTARLSCYSPALRHAFAAIAELDCLLALAASARENGYCRPELTHENVLHITKGAEP